jgi:Tfp pilus assembly protein PilZ
MSKLRMEDRKKLMTFTPVYELPKNNLLGYLGNLTLQGAMLVGHKAAEIDKKMTLAIDFHETPETPATRMTVPVRVAWCRPEKNSPDYNTGVEFLDLSDQNKKVIEAILERYQFRKEPIS